MKFNYVLTLNILILLK
uniref:Uncharacterized protein n=1 Tax=Moumouvirus sp. 'Monve' TaxID=1128131 RepID=H2ECZ2_9VIRU|nr:hypothetical protein mv_L60 [Moumouvirus Monve]